MFKLPKFETLPGFLSQKVECPLPCLAYDQDYKHFRVLIMLSIKFLFWTNCISMTVICRKSPINFHTYRVANNVILLMARPSQYNIADKCGGLCLLVIPTVILFFF